MSAPGPDDDSLMLLASSGRTSAFVVLVERYQVRVRGFCNLLIRDQTQAYDIAQEVFLKVWRRREAYRAEGRFKEYVFTIARNECRSYARKRAVRELLGLARAPEPVAPAHRPCPERIADEDRFQILEAALARLPERFRVPLTLRYIEGLDYAAIARVIGRTESAARSRVFYGLKELAKSIRVEVLS